MSSNLRFLRDDATGIVVTCSGLPFPPTRASAPAGCSGRAGVWRHRQRDRAASRRPLLAARSRPGPVSRPLGGHPRVLEGHRSIGCYRSRHHSAGRYRRLSPRPLAIEALGAPSGRRLVSWTPSIPRATRPFEHGDVSQRSLSSHQEWLNRRDHDRNAHRRGCLR